MYSNTEMGENNQENNMRKNMNVNKYAPMQQNRQTCYNVGTEWICTE